MYVKTYVRLRRNIHITEDEQLYITDFVSFSSSEVETMFKDTVISFQLKQKHRYYVIDGLRILNELNNVAPTYRFELMGPTETVVHIINPQKRPASMLLFLFVWLILFVGAAMTIINFHYDVSMQEVHEKIH